MTHVRKEYFCCDKCGKIEEVNELMVWEQKKQEKDYLKSTMAG